MKFTKMHGLGNDYLYFYWEVPENVRELAVRLSDRHFGAGSDGLIFISRSDTADFRMRIFNTDGSEAMMCGNGILCGGKAVFTDEGQREIRKNIAVYKNNARILMEALDEAHVWYCGGKNAPYFWMKCPDSVGSWAFFDCLLNELQIVGTLGEGFEITCNYAD